MVALITARVFGVEHRFPGCNKWGQGITLVEFMALFINAEIKMINQLGNLIQIVFQAHRESSLMGGLGDNDIKIKLIRSGQGKT